MHFRSKEKIVLMADIDTHGAIAALVSIADSGPATIHALENVSLVMDDRSANSLTASVLRCLSEAVHKITTQNSAMAGKRIARAYAVVHTPWTHSQIVTAKKDFGEPHEIVESDIKDLAHNTYVNKARNALMKQYEAAVIRTRLNGYQTRSPEHKKAQTLEVISLFSDGDIRMLSGIREAFGGSVSREPVFISAERAYLAALSVARPNLENYVLVEVSNEATNIVVVRNRIAEDREYLREGVRTILRRLKQGDLYEETLSSIRMITREECSGPACEAIMASMGKTESELARVFGETFSRLAFNGKLPTDVVLVCDPDLSSWLSAFFARIDFAPFTVTMQPFSATTLSAADLSSSAQCAPDVKEHVSALVGASLVNSIESA